MCHLWNIEFAKIESFKNNKGDVKNGSDKPNQYRTVSHSGINTDGGRDYWVLD